jgi:hypothetical protein
MKFTSVAGDFKYYEEKSRVIPKLLHPKPAVETTVSQADCDFERKLLAHGTPEKLSVEKLIGAANFPKGQKYSVELVPGENGYEKQVKQIKGEKEDHFHPLMGKDILLTLPEGVDETLRKMCDGRYANVVSYDYGRFLVDTSDYTNFTGNFQVDASVFTLHTGILCKSKTKLLNAKEWENIIKKFPDIKALSFQEWVPVEWCKEVPIEHYS